MQHAAQPVAAAIELILLTHATEFNKSTNTGALVAPALEHYPQITVTRLAWSRVAPEPQLLTMTTANPLWLLYPTPEAYVLDTDSAVTTAATNLKPSAEPPSATVQRFIFLDATWQLAHKMYRQSPYLQQLPTLMLLSNRPSAYLLRRNQRQHGWCTAESVALLLEGVGQTAAATDLFEAFFHFNQRK